MVSGQSFGSSLVSLACITSMCSVQCFPGSHSLRSAFGSFFYPHPSPPFILPLLNQCDGCLVPLAWGLMAGGRGFATMGVQLCLGAGCAKVEAPEHPRHPPPLATQLSTRLRSGRINNYNNIFTDGNRIDKESCTIYKLSAIGNVQSLVTFHPIWPYRKR